MIIPMALLKRVKIKLRVCMSCNMPFPRNNTSSTNKSCIRNYVDDTLMLIISPESFTAETSLLKPSTMKRNKKGNIGHPCWSPLDVQQ